MYAEALLGKTGRDSPCFKGIKEKKIGFESFWVCPFLIHQEEQK